MRRLCLLLLLVCIPAGVFAQSVVVRSGEHGDFSRLAFSFSEPVEWKMGRVSGGYEIRLQGNGETIDVSRVYRRISRGRIKDISVSPDNSSITLSVDCTCHADAFEFRPGLLVVDIKDGLPEGSNPFETVFSTDETGAVASGNFSTTESDGVNNSKIDPEPMSLPTPDHLVIIGGKPILEPGVNPKKPTIITAMQAEMLRQIGRASAQGLLKANLPLPTRNSQTVPLPDTLEIVTETPSAQAHINIHIENSVDREISRLLPKGTGAGSGDACIGDDVVNVLEWGDKGSLWEQISAQRRKLSGEFDSTNPEAAIALAEAYIYAGFGVEALRVIDEFSVDPKMAGILKVMARIVDGMAPQQNGVLYGQSGCNSDVALWAVLSQPVLSKGMEINRPKIISAFSALPLHLRRHLGPLLAEKFLKIGDIETASALRNAIARAPGDASAEFRLMEARFEQERGHHDIAEKALAEISTDNSIVALEALIGLLETKANRKSDVSEDVLITAESYLFAQKTNEAGARLLKSIALLRAQSGDLESALKNLRAFRENSFIDAKEERKVWESVLEVADAATDEVFLKFIYASYNEIAKLGVSRSTHQRIAQRLLKLGFVEMALNILDSPARPADIDRLIMAKAALLGGYGQQAVKLLEHVRGEEAARMRAQAFRILGAHDKAAEEYAAISDRDAQKTAIWRARDWDRLQELGSEMEKILARSLVSKSSDPERLRPEEVLARDATLIEESERFRQSIEDLINSAPVPADG